jgi:lipopolysaccharide biosynthesis glycosyltransferase
VRGDSETLRLRIWIGYDSAEQEAYRVAVKTLAKYTNTTPEPLDCARLHANGLLRRAVDRRGQMYDMASNAPCSTEFAISRFLVPILCQSGWALFTDCDVVFMANPRELLAIADPDKAVMVVKHNHFGHGLKMGGMQQTHYPRKNWSSVCLYNTDHPANRRLSLQDVNERPGRDLHDFYWLHDSEIGELPHEWNWLVNVTTKPEYPRLAHFTNGGPWIEDWVPAEHDEIWNEAYSS